MDYVLEVILFWADVLHRAGVDATQVLVETRYPLQHVRREEENLGQRMIISSVTFDVVEVELVVVQSRQASHLDVVVGR